MRCPSCASSSGRRCGPYLALEEVYSGDGFTVRLTNKGVGPAITGEVRLLIGGEPVGALDDALTGFFSARAAKDAYYRAENLIGYDYYRTSVPSFNVVAAGESLTMFGVPWQTDKIDTRRFVDDLVAAGLEATACYCSLDRYCWEVSLTQKLAQPTESCPGID